LTLATAGAVGYEHHLINPPAAPPQVAARPGGSAERFVGNMNKVVQIRFKPGGKVYDFDCGAFVLNLGDPVIVETERGLGFGVVAAGPFTREDADEGPPLKKVYRLARDQDMEQLQKNGQLEQNARSVCRDYIRQLELPMNLFAVEATFDASKLTFFFTSEGRVDFRQLVKMLVRRLGVRIEMRQVGIRNQAKMCGGLGRCGRELCCASFIEKFGPVSIRMAKEQGLSLNPTKISGLCGRLMCCLTFEFDTYRDLKQGMPRIGKTVMTTQGKGKVLRHNVLKGLLAVRLTDGPEIEIGADALVAEKDTSS
jgi:cell fate regulator YaaT (PSP1 superfamily)